MRTAAIASGGAVSLSSISSAIFLRDLQSPRLRADANLQLRCVGQQHAPPPYRIGQLTQHGHSRVPSDAGIGDADAIGQRLTGDQVLAVRVDVTLDHRADDAIVASSDLPCDVVRDVELPLALFLTVRVRKIDH